MSNSNELKFKKCKFSNFMIKILHLMCFLEAQFSIPSGKPTYFVSMQTTNGFFRGCIRFPETGHLFAIKMFGHWASFSCHNHRFYHKKIS